MESLGHSSLSPCHFPPFWQDCGQRLLPTDHHHHTTLPGSASSPGQEMEGGEDVIHLLDEEEEMEFLTFDPTVVTNSSWDAGEVINAFLEKHFSQEVTVEEREGIMKDFPKPPHQFLTAPKLDEEMKKQIKKARKDPHYGSERYLYKLQEQLLDMSRSLNCSRLYWNFW